MHDQGPAPILRLEASCPACRAPGLLLATVEHEVAHFGRTLETLVKCAACGFRRTDFMVLDQREPVRLTLEVSTPEHLFARVVRANSCTWTIPELGFRAEPTPASEAFVTNVEGLLDRAADILLTARDFNLDDPEKKALAERLLERCRAMQEGREPVTVVLEDPFGNSAIGHADVRSETLTPEEAEALSPGMVVFDAADLKERISGA